MGRTLSAQELDKLRLLALSRIPRCRGCPRFHALDALRRKHRPPAAALAQVPEFCTHEVCAPLAARYPAPLIGRTRAADLVGRVKSAC
jgi:hypothetical protein